MESTRRYSGNTSTVVAVIVFATLTIILTILIVNSRNAAAQKARDRQIEHDKGVAFYYDRCTNGGTTMWQC